MTTIFMRFTNRYNVADVESAYLFYNLALVIL